MTQARSYLGQCSVAFAGEARSVCSQQIEQDSTEQRKDSMHVQPGDRACSPQIEQDATEQRKDSMLIQPGDQVS